MKKITPISEQLLSEIEDFCKKTGMSENYFGLQAVNNNKLVKGLRRGRRLWSSSIDEIREYIARGSDI
jgi:hypothetical protein